MCIHRCRYVRVIILHCVRHRYRAGVGAPATSECVWNKVIFFFFFLFVRYYINFFVLSILSQGENKSLSALISRTATTAPTRLLRAREYGPLGNINARQYHCIVGTTLRLPSTFSTHAEFTDWMSNRF